MGPAMAKRIIQERSTGVHVFPPQIKDVIRHA